MLFDILRGKETLLAELGDRFGKDELSEAALNLFKSASVGVWFYDSREDQLYADAVIHANLGLTPGVLGKVGAWRDYIHPEDRAKLDARTLVPLTATQSVPAVYRIIRPDGQVRHIRSWAMASYDEEGGKRFVVGLDRDITETEKLAAQAAETAESFRGLAENVPGAIFRYIRHPDGRDAIEYMSSGCFDLWELTAEQIQGDPAQLWASVFDADRPAMQASVAASAQNLSKWYHRFRVRVPSGRVKHLEARGTPVRQDDGAVLWNTLILDVSDEVALSEELLNQQKMLGQAQKMESLGRIAGGIAHDFNNLLAIIVGHADLIADAGTVEERQELAGEILAACDRGSRLTRHLLSFARRSSLEPTDLDIASTLRSYSKMFERVLPASIALDTVCAAGLWKTRVDPTFFENAILNLCINARDAMPDGGRLTIEASNIRVTEDYVDANGIGILPGRYVLVAVSDTGTGIPPEDLERVIEPFFSTKPQDHGSGLGLPMVEGFVRQSNGALRLYSEPGTGTTVKLFLPALDPADRAMRSPDAGADGTMAGRGRILVVEDEDAIRKVIAITLTRAGYDVAVAGSGDDAMQLHGETLQSFDLLLTDVVMPGKLQGPTLATALTQRAPDIKVIFMSGYPNEAAVHGNGLRASDKFLMKPMMRADLLRVVGQALSD